MDQFHVRYNIGQLTQPQWNLRTKGQKCINANFLIDFDGCVVVIQDSVLDCRQNTVKQSMVIKHVSNKQIVPIIFMRGRRGSHSFYPRHSHQFHAVLECIYVSCLRQTIIVYRVKHHVPCDADQRHQSQVCVCVGVCVSVRRKTYHQ